MLLFRRFSNRQRVLLYHCDLPILPFFFLYCCCLFSQADSTWAQTKHTDAQNVKWLHSFYSPWSKTITTHRPLHKSFDSAKDPKLVSKSAADFLACVSQFTLGVKEKKNVLLVSSSQAIRNQGKGMLQYLMWGCMESAVKEAWKV